MGSTRTIFISVMVIVLAAFACAFAGDTHPVDMGNQDCIACHKDVTPEVYKQWHESAHSYVGVKCQVCHGDAVNFVKSPGNEVCQGCHAQQVEHNQAPQTKCSTCHLAHHFTVHKVHQYK